MSILQQLLSLRQTQTNEARAEARISKRGMGQIGDILTFDDSPEVSELAVMLGVKPGWKLTQVKPGLWAAFNEGDRLSLFTNKRDFQPDDDEDEDEDLLDEAALSEAKRHSHDLHGDWDAFAENPYGTGFDDTPLIDGEVITASSGSTYAVVGISDTGKHLYVIKDDGNDSENERTVAMKPERFGVVILPKGEKPSK